MVPHAPSDQTFASLVVGGVIGGVLSVTSFLAMTGRLTPLASAAYAATNLTVVTALAVFVALGVVFVRLCLRRTDVHHKLSTAERIAAQQRNLSSLPAHFPNAWYKLCDSHEVAIGDTKHVHALNKDVAIFRARGEGEGLVGRGQIHVLDAFCPHLGANMGVGGSVSGNQLECPFHGWRFDGQSGACTSIPYATKVPKTAKTGTWRTAESTGAVFMWYDVDFAAPGWDVASPLASPSPSAGVHHGRVLLDVPGNVAELALKHADSWSGELPASASAAASESVVGFTLAWDAPKPWVVSSSASARARQNRVSTLCFLSFPLPLASFRVEFTQAGPSVLYASFAPRSVLARLLLGSIVVAHALRPRDAFECAVDVTVASTTGAQGAGVFGRAIDALATPLRRGVAKLVLALWTARFRARVLPVYVPRKLAQPLSLRNSAASKAALLHRSNGGEQKSDSDDEPQSLPSPERSRGSVSPALPESLASPARSTRVRGYRSTSVLATTYWKRFYSASGVKRIDGLEW